TRMAPAAEARGCGKPAGRARGACRGRYSAGGSPVLAEPTVQSGRLSNGDRPAQTDRPRSRASATRLRIAAVLYRFGPFTLDAGSFALHRGDTPVPLPPKLLDLVRYLVAKPSTLVSKEELFQALWPDVVVTENALTQAVSDLRQALGDDRSRPTYIQTVAKRGYRFVAPVEAVATEPAPPRARPRRETSSLDANRALMEG